MSSTTAAGIERALSDLLAAAAPRAKSLIVTVIGDSLAPHGGTVWLSSLIDLVRPLGLNERLVRTAVLRLTRDDWLCSTQVGRRSVYSVSDAGRHRLDDVEGRIYGLPRDPWDRKWRLVFTGLGRADAGQREKLRRELLWLGYGAVAPNVFAHPSTDFTELQPIASALDLRDDIVTMTADSTGRGMTGGLAGTAHDLVQKSWDLGELSAAYGVFLSRFDPLMAQLKSIEPSPESCFVLRTVLIHEYRRVRLRDPELPAELMPADWEGAAARDLCRDLYRRVQAGCERHLMVRLETPDGALPSPKASYYERFGGLASCPPAPARSGAVGAYAR